MKRTFFVLSALFLIIGVTNAQDSNPPKPQNNTQTEAGGRVHKVEHLVFLNGKMYRTRQGVVSEVKEEIRLENGITVKLNGAFVLQNNKRRFLRDGECLDMEGNRYASLTDFNTNHRMWEPKKDKNANQAMTQNQPGATGDKKADRP